MEPKFAKGREVSYSTFDRTLEYLTKKAHNTFFRGQVDYSWGLQTKLGRTLEKVGNPNLNAIAFESSMIGAFKREYSAHSESRPHDADLLGWLARMQHYGAPTRLLDWTLSPQIALYFACRDLDKDTDGAVWLFNPIPSASVHSGSPMPGPWDHLQLWRIEPDGSPRWTDPELSTFEDLQNTRIRNAIATDSRWPLPVIPNWVDQRMAGQQSVFLLIGNLDFPMESLSFKNQWKLSRSEERR